MSREIKIVDKGNNRFLVNDTEMIYAPNIATAKLRYEKKFPEKKEDKNG